MPAIHSAQPACATLVRITWHIVAQWRSGLFAMQQKRRWDCHHCVSSTDCGKQWATWMGTMMATRQAKILGWAATALGFALLMGAAKSGAQSPPAAEADVLIKNGRVVDGTGAPWFQADVAIT